MRGTARVTATAITQITAAGRRQADDWLAVEAPLEIRARAGAEEIASVTLRTPGDDEALALGFLFAEGAVTAADDVLAVSVTSDAVTVELAPARAAALAPLRRATAVTAACGACGKG